jgi:hypothetical protein
MPEYVFLPGKYRMLILRSLVHPTLVMLSDAFVDLRRLSLCWAHRWYAIGNMLYKMKIRPFA